MRMLWNNPLRYVDPYGLTGLPQPFPHENWIGELGELVSKYGLDEYLARASRYFGPFGLGFGIGSGIGTWIHKNQRKPGSCPATTPTFEPIPDFGNA